MDFLFRKRIFPILLAAALVVFFAGFAYTGIEDNIKKSFTVNPGGTLTLDTDIGSISVEGVKGNKVEVEVLREARTDSEKKAEEIFDNFEIDFSQKGDDVNITADYERDGWSWFEKNVGKYLRVKFIISVPQSYNLKLKTSGGGIEVNDLEGEINCKTSGGSLSFDNVIGPVWGRTSGGSVRVGEVDGNIDVHTSGGSIKIERAKGDINAHTSGGGITVEEVMGTIQADTSGGSIKAYISKQPQANCRLTTSGGSITAYLAENINVFLDARTSGGSIHTEFPITLKGKIDKSALKAKINDGGPELYLRTSGGSIYIRKK